MKCSNLVQNRVNCLYVTSRTSMNLRTKADRTMVTGCFSLSSGPLLSGTPSRLTTSVPRYLCT